MADDKKAFDRDLDANPPLTWRIVIGVVGSLSKNMTMEQLASFITENLDTYTKDEIDDFFSDYLSKDNLASYTPTLATHPATKGYVDDGGEVVGWTNLTASSGTSITRAKVSQVGKMITITALFSLGTTTANSTILTIPSTIGTATINIDFIAGDRDSEGEEILELYIPSGTRTIKLREAGNTPNDYSFTLTYPAI